MLNVCYAVYHQGGVQGLHRHDHRPQTPHSCQLRQNIGHGQGTSTSMSGSQQIRIKKKQKAKLKDSLAISTFSSKYDKKFKGVFKRKLENTWRMHRR